MYSLTEAELRFASIFGSPFSEKEDLEREIKRVDDKIGELIYDLYELTGNETKIVADRSPKSL